jgi:hypothetical protein
VPCAFPMPYCEANDRALYCDPALVGLLARPSSGPKLPDLLCAALLSLPPLADWFWAEVRIPCSCGVAVLPMGVARLRMGRGGRLDACGTALLTGLTAGDGGMARPSLGVRVPLAERAPGMAGRRRGTGEDMIGIGLDVVIWGVLSVGSWRVT